jgi:hypothetical protein
MNKKSKTPTQQALQHTMQSIDRRRFVRLTALAAVSALGTGANVVNASAALPETETAEGLAHFLAHFEATSAKYGYWNATPEENAAVGIRF